MKIKDDTFNPIKAGGGRDEYPPSAKPNSPKHGPERDSYICLFLHPYWLNCPKINFRTFKLKLKFFLVLDSKVVMLRGFFFKHYPLFMS